MFWRCCWRGLRCDSLGNAGLDAEVRDLKQGIDAVEERARVELGMIKPGEVFYQVVDKSKAKL